jgi:hypothetical protein
MVPCIDQLYEPATRHPIIERLNGELSGKKALVGDDAGYNLVLFAGESVEIIHFQMDKNICTTSHPIVLFVSIKMAALGQVEKNNLMKFPLCFFMQRPFLNVVEGQNACLSQRHDEGISHVMGVSTARELFVGLSPSRRVGGTSLRSF